MQENLQAALSYAARGWPVFPIAAGAKVPRAGTHGSHDASKDEDEIRRWFETRPHLNVGVACGRRSGLFVLDVDEKNGKSGAKTLLDWEREGRLLPETAVQRTTTGGKQYLFKIPNGTVVSNSAGVLGEGVDIRGEGGYFVAPPSRLMGGRRYTWCNDNPVSDAPEWLIQKLSAVKQQADDKDPMDLSLADVVPGAFADHPGCELGAIHDNAIRLAGRELAAGHNPAKIVADAVDWARRCTPTESVDQHVAHVLKSVQDILRREAAAQPAAGDSTDDYVEPSIDVSHPFAISSDDWTPFPLACLPDCIREYVEKAAAGMSADPAMIALPILASLAGVIGNSLVVRIDPGWVERAILWTLVVAESGSQKTPAHRKAIRFVVQIDDELHKTNEQEDKAYKRQLLEYDADLASWKLRSKKGAAGPPPEKPEQPPQRVLVVNDITPEAIGAVLTDNPRGILVECDELSAWISGFDRYAGGGGGVSQEVGRWLSMHNATALRINRKLSARVRVPRAAASIAGGIQPKIMIAAIGSQHVDNGLLPRFLIAAPPRRPKKRNRSEVSPALTQEIQKVINRLFARTYGDEPQELPLSRDADKMWDDFYREHALRQQSAHGVRASVLAKVEAAAARIALVIHATRVAAGEGVSSDAIDGESMKRGIILARWFAAEWNRIYTATLGRSPLGEIEQLILNIVRDAGGAISDRVLRGRSRKLRNTDVRSRGISNLVKAGELETFSPAHHVAGPPPLWLRLPAPDDGRSPVGQNVAETENTGPGTGPEAHSSPPADHGIPESINVVTPADEHVTDTGPRVSSAARDAYASGAGSQVHDSPDNNENSAPPPAGQLLPGVPLGPGYGRAL